MLAAAAAELSTPKKANLDDVKKQAQEIQTPEPKAAPGPQSSVPKSSSIEEVKKKAEELQKSMHLGGFAPAPKDTAYACSWTTIAIQNYAQVRS